MLYLGVDFGLKRVGLAVSEGNFASPWKIIEGFSIDNLVMRVDKIARAGQFDKIVVGLPEGETGKAAMQFIDKLKRRGLDIESVDETLSTQRANRLMIEMGLPRKKRQLADAQAAAQILRNYLERL